MQFNASEEWLRKMAEAEDGANVCIGAPFTAEEFAKMFGEAALNNLRHNVAESKKKQG